MTATIITPNAAKSDPVRIAALLGVVLTVGEPEPDWETVGVVTEVPLLPVPVPVGVAAVPLDEATTIPPPWDGESPPPEETTPESVPVAAVERDEAALETSEDADPESVGLEEGLGIGEVVGAEDSDEPSEVVGLEAALVVGLVEISLQERSNNGPPLKSLPTIPKLGLGVDGSAS